MIELLVCVSSENVFQQFYLLTSCGIEGICPSKLVMQSTTLANNNLLVVASASRAMRDEGYLPDIVVSIR